MSDWKQRAAERRDFRHSTDGPEEARPPKRKKDTKNWCKGKVGVEHQWEYKRDESFPRMRLHRYVCLGCGKKEWKQTGQGR